MSKGGRFAAGSYRGDIFQQSLSGANPGRVVTITLFVKRLLNIGLQDFFVAAATVTVLAVQMQHFADDPGLGWHIKSGEYMLRNLHVPQVDFLLASDQPRPWLTEQWLGSLAIYVLYALGSWPLAYAAMAGVFLISYFVFLYRSAYLYYGLAASFACIYAFKLAQVHFILRPIIFNYLFFSITYVLVYQCLLDFRANFKELPRLRKHFLVLPLVFLLWANIHPAFVYGLCLLLLLPLSLIAESHLLKSHYDKLVLHALLRRFTLLAALCALVTLVNPNGPALHGLLLEFMRSGFAMSLYEEWKGLNLASFEGRAFVLSVFIVLISRFLRGERQGRWGVFEVMLFAGFSFLTLSSVRLLPFFSVILVFPLAESLCRIYSCLISLMNNRLSSLKLLLAAVIKREAESSRGLPLLCSSVCFILLYSVIAQDLPFFRGNFGPSKTKFPFAAVQYLNRLTESKDKSTTVVNYIDWGGFISLTGNGKCKPIIDDRTSMLGEKHYRDYFAALNVGGDWQGYIRRLKADYLLWPRQSQFSSSLQSSAKLSVIYADDRAVLFDTSILIEQPLSGID